MTRDPILPLPQLARLLEELPEDAAGRALRAEILALARAARQPRRARLIAPPGVSPSIRIEIEADDEADTGGGERSCPCCGQTLP